METITYATGNDDQFGVRDRAAQRPIHGIIGQQKTLLTMTKAFEKWDCFELRTVLVN